MLDYIYQTLMFFRKAFSRHSTWLVFCMVILGFIGTHDMVGVTSFCRFWCLDTAGYHAFLHFFRASVWSLDRVVEFWTAFVLSQNETVMNHGRAVMFGDHTCVPKDGRQMPCVVTLKQHSETQTKPSYFRGHHWGAVGMLVGSMISPFCIPLSLAIHQGLVHVNEKDKSEETKETLGTRIVQMALDFAMRHDLPSILILDAFFPWCGSIQNGGLRMVYPPQAPTAYPDHKSQKERCRLFPGRDTPAKRTWTASNLWGEGQAIRTV